VLLLRTERLACRLQNEDPAGTTGRVRFP
jgi:hypothetical protein